MAQPDLGEKLILRQLEDQQQQLRSIEERVRNIEINLGILKTKAGFIGAICGAIPSMFLWWLNG